MGPGLKIDAVHAANAHSWLRFYGNVHLIFSQSATGRLQLSSGEGEGRENACALVRVNPLSCRFLPRCCRDFTNFLGEGAAIIGVVPAWREGRGESELQAGADIPGGTGMRGTQARNTIILRFPSDHYHSGSGLCRLRTPIPYVHLLKAKDPSARVDSRTLVNWTSLPAAGIHVRSLLGIKRRSSSIPTARERVDRGTKRRQPKGPLGQRHSLTPLYTMEDGFRRHHV
jgi:hypothetical protein